MLRGQTKAKVITIADDCNVLQLTAGEGGEHEHEHGHAEHGTAASEPSHEAHHSDVNPHTWVSPRQAAREVRTLARKLGEVDRTHTDQYRKNGEAYAARIEALADKMESAARGFKNRNIVTGHAAFDYLARDLGLNVVATLHIVPGETGSASEMAHIIDTIRKTHAAAVFQEPPFSDKMADTIARDAGVPMYPLNPLNSDAGLPKPKTVEDARRMYEEAMLQNLATLQQALGTTTTTRPAHQN
jgi:ABC-type Zn uptake system ZnuABC Zn-binding protein ZnuA